MRQSILERIVEERVGQSLVGNVSTAIDRIAEEIAIYDGSAVRTEARLIARYVASRRASPSSNRPASTAFSPDIKIAPPDLRAYDRLLAGGAR